MACCIFVTVIVFILWRPRKVHEAIPAILGAAAMMALGYISSKNVMTVLSIVSGAGVTIISTIIMSSILGRVGVFQWAANQIVRKANGSGKSLFVLVLLLCFLMTMFFNNDGSVLITTPIILQMVKDLKLTKVSALPYLLGGALIATSSSAPIGVSNLANLIALRIVGLNLNAYAKLMFLPSMIGIAICGCLLYLIFRRNLPARYQITQSGGGTQERKERQMPIRLHPHGPPIHPRGKPPVPPHKKRDSAERDAGITMDPLIAKVGIAIVILARFGLFVAQALHIPIELVALTGATLLLVFYAGRNPQGATLVLRKAPWLIVVFAFGMYLIVYGLNNIGLTAELGNLLKTLSDNSLFKTIFFTGGFLTVMSCLMNNLPSVMIGTTMLTALHLHTQTLQLSYLANILGSDIGSLLLPLGTLASLMWFHMVSKQYSISWKDYMSVSFRVIPLSLIASLFALYIWGKFIL